MYTTFTLNVNTVYNRSLIEYQSIMNCAKKAYHHGELREALLETAETLLQEDGPSGLSLRKVGRQLGVTPGAPYRHFEDKDALLAALATEGFRKLRAAILGGQEGSVDGQERLRRAGVGYLSFASSHPELFRLMFGWMPARDVPELCDAGDAAFAAFEEDVKGSLTPGKYADITVLSKDLLTVPVEEIPTAEVVYTIVGGKVAYEKSGP